MDRTIWRLAQDAGIVVEINFFFKLKLINSLAALIKRGNFKNENIEEEGLWASW
jgi:hypothetical protein